MASTKCNTNNCSSKHISWHFNITFFHHCWYTIFFKIKFTIHSNMSFNITFLTIDSNANSIWFSCKNTLWSIILNADIKFLLTINFTAGDCSFYYRANLFDSLASFLYCWNNAFKCIAQRLSSISKPFEKATSTSNSNLFCIY